MKTTEHEIFITVPLSHLQNTKVSIANSSLDTNHITSSFITQISDSTPQTFIKTTFHP